MSSLQTTTTPGPGQSAPSMTDAVLAGIMADLGDLRREQLPLEGEIVHVDLAKLDASRRANRQGTEEWRTNRENKAWVSSWNTFAKSNDDGDDPPDMGHGQLHRAKIQKDSEHAGGHSDTRYAGRFHQRDDNATGIDFSLPATGRSSRGELRIAPTQVFLGRRGRARARGPGDRSTLGGLTTVRNLAETLNQTATRDIPRRTPRQPAIELGRWGSERTSNNHSDDARSGFQYPASLSFDDQRPVNELPVPGVSSVPTPSPCIQPSKPSAAVFMSNGNRRGSNASAMSSQARSTGSRKDSSSKSFAQPKKRPWSQQAIDAVKPSLADPDSFMSATAKIFPAVKEPTVAGNGAPTTPVSAPNGVASSVQSSTAKVSQAANEATSSDAGLPADMVSTLNEVASHIQTSISDETKGTKAAPEKVAPGIQSSTSAEIKAAPEGGIGSSQPTVEAPADPPVQSLLDLDMTVTAAQESRPNVQSSYLKMFGLESQADIEAFDFDFRYPVNGSIALDKLSSKNALSNDSVPKMDPKGDLGRAEVEPSNGQDGNFYLLLDFGEDNPSPNPNAVEPVKESSSVALMERELLSDITDISTRFAALRLQPKPEVEVVSKGASKDLPKTVANDIAKDISKDVSKDVPKNDFKELLADQDGVEASAVKINAKNTTTDSSNGVSMLRSSDNSAIASPIIQSGADNEPLMKAAELAENRSVNGNSAQESSLLQPSTPELQQRTTTRSSVFSSGMSESRYADIPSSSLGLEKPSPTLGPEMPPYRASTGAALKAFTGGLGRSRWAEAQDAPPARRAFTPGRSPTPSPRASIPGPITVFYAGNAGTAGGSGAAPFFNGGQGQPPLISPPAIPKPVTIRNPRTGEVVHENNHQKKKDDKKDDNSPKSKWTTPRFS